MALLANKTFIFAFNASNFGILFKPHKKYKVVIWSEYVVKQAKKLQRIFFHIFLIEILIQSYSNDH